MKSPWLKISVLENPSRTFRPLTWAYHAECQIQFLNFRHISSVDAWLPDTGQYADGFMKVNMEDIVSDRCKRCDYRVASLFRNWKYRINMLLRISKRQPISNQILGITPGWNCVIRRAKWVMRCRFHRKSEQMPVGCFMTCRKSLPRHAAFCTRGARTPMRQQWIKRRLRHSFAWQDRMRLLMLFDSTW